MKAEKTPAYSYLRFSLPQQAKGDSLRRQTELRNGWLARSGAVLDTSLTLEDHGVSGFTGQHRENADRHALAAFLSLVKSGRIARGSFLIVESLDRLSREDIIPALSLLLDLIQSGIRVVQLLPVETVYDAQSNPMHLMMAIMELARGHSESAMKSERVGSAWREKKKRAAADKEPVTARTPAWVRKVDDRLELIDSAAATVRRIFRMATDGYGIGAITKTLNGERVPTLGQADYWPASYVAKILNNRAAVGEYQPYKGRPGKRVPDGKPIAGYYPAVISEDEWYAAKAAMAQRKERPGRLAKVRINVFAGLLHDARNGGSLQQTNKGKKGGGSLLISYRARQGVEGCKGVSFPLGGFERSIFQQLREIDLRDILPQKDRGADKVLALSGRLAELEGEIEKVKARLLAKYSDALADVLDRHETEQRELSAQFAAARRQASSPLADAWGQCRSLLDVIDNAPDEADLRVRLRAALRRIVDGVWCLFVGRQRARLAAVQIWFTRGGHRDYLIYHHPRLGGAVGSRPEVWSVQSFATKEATGKELDLRKPEHVRRLERVLEAIDLEALNP